MEPCNPYGLSPETLASLHEYLNPAVPNTKQIQVMLQRTVEASKKQRRKSALHEAASLPVRVKVID